MATFKFETESRFGKFFAHLRKAGDPKPDLTKQPALDSAKAMGDFLADEVDRVGLVERQDSIIWRNHSYEDFDQLADEIRRANY